MDIQLQLEKSICEIIKEEGYGLGFFTKINYKGNEIICLMTNCNSISEEMLNKDYIEIKIANKILKKIYLNKKRWVNKDLGYICIEISKDDDIEIIEIDDNFWINKDNDKDIIIASINKDKKFEVLKDKLIDLEICDKFYYYCHRENEFLGGLIILNNNLKIIGIHFGNEIKGNLIEGIYIINIIKDINRYNLIEGILDIKNNLLFNSRENMREYRS